MIVNLIDVDGTLCPSIFNNDRLKNDNKNCLTPEFLKDLAEVKPYTWWFDGYHDWNADDASDSEKWAGQVCILVTGRLPQHEQLTLDWFTNLCGYDGAPDSISFVSVPWDDTCETREESYRNYCGRKFMKLLDLITTWLRTLTHSNIKPEIHVYEDDTVVLSAVKKETDWVGPALHLHVVDKNGEVHPYP